MAMADSETHTAPAAEASIQHPTTISSAIAMSEIEKPAAAAAVDSPSPSHPESSSNPTSPPPATALSNSLVTNPATSADESSSTPADNPPATTTTTADTPPPTVPTKEKDVVPDSDSLSIEPSSAVPAASASAEPICNITLLLPTGARHPYKIDERYLAKRNVAVPDSTEAGGKDPFSISVYTLKELILREWREEWNDRPASPSSIRLIHFGKLLEDKEQLKKYQFSRESPNVVHMSVRPAEMMEEDEAAKGKGSGRDGRRERGGGCCVIL